MDEALVYEGEFTVSMPLDIGTPSTQLTVVSVLELVDGCRTSVHHQRRIEICEGGGLLGMEGGSLYQWHSTT